MRNKLIPMLASALFAVLTLAAAAPAQYYQRPRYSAAAKWKYAAARQKYAPVAAAASPATAAAAATPASSPSSTPEATPTPAPAPTSTAPPLGEDERLAFMQTPGTQNPAAAEPSTGGLALKMLASLLAIVGLLFAGVWAVRKYAPGVLGLADAPDDGTLSVMNTVQLGNGRSVSTIRFGERVLLVGATAQSVTLLAEDEYQRQDANDAIDAPPVAVTRSVGEMLGEAGIDDADFAAEFERAERRFEAGSGGGRAS